MTIEATLHPFLTGVKELQLDVKGNTVGECLDSSIKEFPALEQQIFQKKVCQRGAWKFFLTEGAPLLRNG